MDQKGVETPSRGLDIKGLGSWSTWPNRFAILDAEYYTMLHNRTQSHGVYIDMPYEPSNYSNQDGQIISRFEDRLTDDSTTTYCLPLPSHNTHVSSEGFPAGHEPELQMNDVNSTQDNKPQAKRSRVGLAGIALDPESSVIGASYTLSLLQNYRDDGVSWAHRWNRTEPRDETNTMAQLSAVARGLCRKPGEVVALCLEIQRNTLTAITQSQLGGDDVEQDLRTVGEDKGTFLPVEVNVQRCA